VGATAEHGKYVAKMCIGCHGLGLAGGKIPGAPPQWPAASNREFAISSEAGHERRQPDCDGQTDKRIEEPLETPIHSRTCDQFGVAAAAFSA
jgi:hypothetical protein